MQHNPFIGPRAYSAGEDVQLYGRDCEAVDLLALLVSQRLVLLYSPSGAGKTSLIESKLVPEMERLGFQVLPRIRVGLELPSASLANRYSQSALLSLQSDRSILPFFGGTKHTRQDFKTYMQAQLQAKGPARGLVLIFDQFEEILTLNPTDTASKEEFFAELGDILLDRRLWVLFVIREEYLGPLESYVTCIPTHLASRYRLDLLGREAARDAILGPARERGVHCSNEAIDLLVDDLRITKEMGYDGEAKDVPGPVIEPVHLQVACHRLWERVAERGFALDEKNRLTITSTDVTQVGNVAAALREYYGEVVSRVSQAPGVEERKIRQWVGTQLITGGRFRNQVMRQGRRTAGLPETVVEQLSSAYLVRVERRRGVVWYELAHDRLIDPVLEDNMEWFTNHPTELQKLAEAWKQQGRNKALLLRGEELDETSKKAGKTSDLGPLEQEYLEASRTADEKAAKRRSRRRMQATTAMAIVSVVATGMTLASVNLSVRNISLRGENDTLSAQLQDQSVLRTLAVGQAESRDTLLTLLQAALEGTGLKRDSANQRLRNIVSASDTTPPDDSASGGALVSRDSASGPLVTYFARPGEGALVEAALRPLGYRLRRKETENLSATNQVLYGARVPVEDAKRTALALVAAGVPIKRIAMFQTRVLLESNEMQVLSAPQLDTVQPLPADTIRQLSRQRTRVGPRIYSAPPPVDTTRVSTPGDSQRTQPVRPTPADARPEESIPNSVRPDSS